MKAADKIVEGLTQFMEGFVELQTQVEEEYQSESDDGGDTEDPDVRVEIDAALVTEIRACIEAVMDSEDYAADELATLVSIAQDALEDIDPDVFEEAEEDEESDEDVVYEDDEDFSDLEDDDLDEEFDDEDDDEDEEDDEEEEEEDDDDY